MKLLTSRQAGIVRLNQGFCLNHLAGALMNLGLIFNSILVPDILAETECRCPSFNRRGVFQKKPCRPLPLPALTRVSRNLSARTEAAKTSSTYKSTLIGTSGRPLSQAHPAILS